MTSLIGRSIDNVIGSVDVDGIVARIDVDHLVGRIDWNKVLDSVDIDRQIARVDVNAILDRIDIDKLVERSNLEAIVARSSSGIFQQILDLIRIQIVRLDMCFHQLSRCKCRDKEIYLPPVPKPRKKNKSGGRPLLGSAASQKLSDRMVEVQGAYSGVVSRICLYAIDETLTLTTFGLASLLVEGIAQRIPGDRTYDIQPILLATIIIIWGANIRLVSLLACRRTLGMALVGVMLVNLEGRRPKWWQIVVRQFLQPIFSLPGINAFSLMCGWMRSDGRFPHDLLTLTGVIYSWNVRISMLRLNHWKRLEDHYGENNSNEEFDNLYP